MPDSTTEKVISVQFFKTPAGNEPVRDWLKAQTPEEENKMKNKYVGGSFNDFLEEENIRAEVEAGAIKK